jgi:hypothetical protein
MSVTGRQNNLFLAEDWKKVYQTFKNADFTSYDFENLRRVMISYLRENYPEDFNDYIESSEYLALIDLIAFLGQSLAFRIDLNARENFLELADRRESVLRLAQLISYNVKRNTTASGLLKIDSISTTEEIIDSTGKNLSDIEISWNDATNTNWNEQFIKVMNSAMISENEFGVPQNFDTVDGIYTEQYRMNSQLPDLPIFPFSKAVDGKSMNFEVVSTVLDNAGNIIEDSPKYFNKVAMLYRDDQKGYGSVNTGWFIHFRQGSLVQKTFSISTPNVNEIIEITESNINDSDVWLYSLNSQSLESEKWTKVSATTGNNIIYNSISKDIKNIFAVQTKINDSIALLFADGIFGNLPKGVFRCYYRTSNGLSYSIQPKDVKGVLVTIPYISKIGTQETLKLVLSLKTSSSNANTTETNTDVKMRAPAAYYTQGRMITGEDYNLAPLAASQNIAKVKSINRTASGISRNFDLIDASGKYSNTTSFCNDGVIYRKEFLTEFNFSFNNRSEIENTLNNKIKPILTLNTIRDFYYEKFSKIPLNQSKFIAATNNQDETTGYFEDLNDNLPLKVGVYTGSNFKHIQPGALVKFVPPTGYYFSKDGSLLQGALNQFDRYDRIWAKVISIVGDGTASGIGILSTGIGPIRFNESIPSNAIVSQVIPKFIRTTDTGLDSVLIDLMFNYKNFGLRYDVNSAAWIVIQERNLNIFDPWSNGRAGDNTGNNLDSSWLLVFETDGSSYRVSYRGLEYYFESIKENRFFFDGSKKIYDIVTGKLQKDKVTVLKFNTQPLSTASLIKDYPWEIIGTVNEEDGYASGKVVKITFSDSNDDGIVDNPDSFNVIVDSNETNLDRFVFFEKYVNDFYNEDYRLIENTKNKFLILKSESLVTTYSSYTDGQLFYFYDNDIIKRFDYKSSSLKISNDYYAAIGRYGLYFQYIHNADSSARIDPSATNIMDVYILNKSYDNLYRKYLKGDITEEPLPPSSTDLKAIYGPNLDKIKSISDSIVFHPVKYKLLFGKNADRRLQASFKVVKNAEQVITDNEVKTKIIQSINEFFSIDNWDFGDTFFFTELSAYVMNKLSPYITIFLIVPTNNDQVFGSLQQITSAPNELFVSGALVSDIEIIQSITASKLRINNGIVMTSSGFDSISTNLLSNNTQ